MLDNNPQISVVLPVFNAEKFLVESIKSILNQTFIDFELIIINDGSSDNSLEIIKSIIDRRIILINNNQNMGLVRTLNKGFSLAKGKYIARMDADDIALPGRFMIQFNFMEKNPAYGACGSWFKNIGSISGISKYESDYNKIRFIMLYQLPVLHPSIMIRKEVLQVNKLEYDEKYLQCEDYDFFVRIAEVTKVSNIPKVLIKYRRHSETLQALYPNDFAIFKKKIILLQFNKIGILIKDDEIELFTKFCQSGFSLSFDNLRYLESFLIKVINANKKTKYLNHDSLNEIIGEKWFHLCYNLIGKQKKIVYNKYKTSPLSCLFLPDKYLRIKFLIKNILYR